MQTVSDNWKNTHKQTLLNESFVEISFDITDPTAQEDATSISNGQSSLSTTTIDLTDDYWENHYLPGYKELFDVIPKYRTLEQNFWVLDGTGIFIKATGNTEPRYVSDVLSDEMCVFSEKIPTITLTFSEKIIDTIAGITITWSELDEEYATNFIVKAYLDDDIIAEKEIVDNHSVKSLVLVDMVGYNRIEIYVKKWCLPHHRARVEYILMGMNKVYSKAGLFSYSHKQSVSPLSTSLPKNEIRFSVNNTNGEYNPHNESGLSKYLMNRQRVKARYGLKLNDGTTEWIKGGTFYLSDWSAKQNGLTADFAARDSLELLTFSFSSLYQENASLISLDTMLMYIGKIVSETNGSSNIKWDNSLSNIYTDAPLPKDTIANCLQLIANAGECVLYEDREGVIHIEPLKDDETDYSISAFNSYSKPEVTLSKPLKQVDVKVYTYTQTDDGVKGSVTDTVSVVVGTVGETIVVDNPLITDAERAESVGNWMANHLKHRMTLNSSWRADVRLDALDIVSIPNTYNTAKVIMTDVEFKYNGAFRGTGEGKVI